MQQAQDELDVKSELQRRNPGIVPQRDIESCRWPWTGAKALDAANAVQAVRGVAGFERSLPAEKASAQAALAAGAGRSRTRPSFVPASTAASSSSRFDAGDVVNPMMRPAGILIPEGAGQRALQAGFGQIEAQVLKVGMVAEAACISKPWTIIPMVVTNVQDYIAAGQFRGGEQLIEVQNIVRPGTILVFHGAALQGRPGGRDRRQQLYRQRLYQQSRADFFRQAQHGEELLAACRRRGRAWCMPVLLRIQALLLPIKTPGAERPLVPKPVDQMSLPPREPAWFHLRMPAWLGIVVIGTASSFWSPGAGLFGYVWYSRPTTLTIAAGSLDGEATKAGVGAGEAGSPQRMRRYASTWWKRPARLRRPICFHRTRSTSPWCGAMSAICRRRRPSSSSPTPCVLLVAPPGSSITDVAGLKRLAVGVVGGEMNRKVVSAF